MKAILVAIAAIGLAGCTTYPNEDARKADQAATPIATRAADQVATPTATVALAGESEIRPACEEEWSGDWAMIALCVERQTQGFRDVQRLLDEHNIPDGDTTPEAEIFAKCSSEWQSHQGRPDWAMIALCSERQVAGYRQLHPK